MRARPAGEILPLRVLLAPVRAETALLICSSRDERRFRSYSSCLSAEVRLVMEADGTRCNYPRYRSATHSFEQTSERSFFEKGEATFSRPPTSFTRQSLYVSGAYAALP